MVALFKLGGILRRKLFAITVQNYNDRQTISGGISIFIINAFVVTCCHVDHYHFIIFLQFFGNVLVSFK